MGEFQTLDSGGRCFFFSCFRRVCEGAGGVSPGSSRIRLGVLETFPAGEGLGGSGGTVWPAVIAPFGRLQLF